ncbi:hypothetical protein EW146_g6987 [Bondarzewia mesenterica]|uniref:Ras modification protein ERF4 n=1 Tax=Bondarzewia mesenterica TaxID=1095465 RepID=A0A4S4LM06_9AGAM|nr:hypothetical protein EW146_g6987 [Bondarzewia mesenterica]
MPLVMSERPVMAHSVSFWDRILAAAASQPTDEDINMAPTVIAQSNPAIDVLSQSHSMPNDEPRSGWNWDAEVHGNSLGDEVLSESLSIVRLIVWSMQSMLRQTVPMPRVHTLARVMVKERGLRVHALTRRLTSEETYRNDAIMTSSAVDDHGRATPPLSTSPYVPPPAPSRDSTHTPPSVSPVGLPMNAAASSTSLADSVSVLEIVAPSSLAHSTTEEAEVSGQRTPVPAPAPSLSEEEEGRDIVDDVPAVRILGVNYVPPNGRVSPIVVSGRVGDEDGAAWEGMSHERSASPKPTSPQHTDVHPLRFDVQPPSPTSLWEAAGLSHEVGQSEYKPPASFHHKKQHSRRLIPISSYYFGPPPMDSAYGTEPTGQIGVHHPREIVRIERDYSAGEIAQFSATYPLELEGRITPTQFLETINGINEILISAHSLRYSFLDNALDIVSLHLSSLFLPSHYEREMARLRRLIDGFNKELYNPVGLNIVWPRQVAFLFFEIEYY